MIEQQLYSRGSYGLTLRSAGHDTVAASAGLSEEELKELNGYTTYYQSELVNSNGEMIPVVLKRKLPNGRIMFSKRVPRRYYDSSGQRNTFLAHNYIIKEGSQEEDNIIHDVRKLFDSGVFITSFDEGVDSTQMPQLTELPLVAQYDQFAALNMLLDRKFVSEEFLVKLVVAVLNAIEEKEHVVIFNSKFDNEAIPVFVLQAICNFVPYSFRKKLTFLTFLGDTNIDADYTVIFAPPISRSRTEHSGMLYDFEVKNGMVCSLDDNKVDIDGFPKECGIDRYIGFIENNIRTPEKVEEFLNYFEKFSEDVGIDNPCLRDIENAFVYYSKEYLKTPEDLEMLVNTLFEYCGYRQNGIIEKHIVGLMKEKATESVLSDNLIRKLIKIIESDEINDRNERFKLLFSSVSRTISVSDDMFYRQLDICLSSPEIENKAMTVFFRDNTEVSEKYYTYKFSQLDTIDMVLFEYLKMSNNDLLNYGNIHLAEMDHILQLMRVRLNSFVVDIESSLPNSEEKPPKLFELLAEIDSFYERFESDKIRKMLSDIACNIINKICRIFEITFYSAKIDDIRRVAGLKNTIFYSSESEVSVTQKSKSLLEDLEKICTIYDDSLCLETVDQNRVWLDCNRKSRVFDWFSNYYKDSTEKVYKKDYRSLLWVNYNYRENTIDFSDIFLQLAKSGSSVPNFIKWICHDRFFFTKLEFIKEVLIDGEDRKKPTNVKERKKRFLNAVLSGTSKIIKENLLDNKAKKEYYQQVLEVIGREMPADVELFEYFKNALSAAISGKKYNPIPIRSQTPSSAKSSGSGKKNPQTNKNTFSKVLGNIAKNIKNPWIMILPIVLVLAIVAGMVLPYPITAATNKKNSVQTYNNIEITQMGMMIERLDFAEVKSVIGVVLYTEPETQNTVTSEERFDLSEIESDSQTIEENQTDSDDELTSEEETKSDEKNTEVSSTDSVLARKLNNKSQSTEKSEAFKKVEALNGVTHKNVVAKKYDNTDNFFNITAYYNSDEKVFMYSMYDNAGYKICFDPSFRFIKIEKDKFGAFVEYRDGNKKIHGIYQTVLNNDNSKAIARYWFDKDLNLVMRGYFSNGVFGTKYKYFDSEDKRLSKSDLKEEFVLFSYSKNTILFSS